MRVALDDQSLKIHECRIRPDHRDLLRLHQPPHDLRDFNVDEVWRVQTFRRTQSPGGDALCPRRLQHKLYGRGRVEHDQRSSRSSRSTWVGDTFP